MKIKLWLYEIQLENYVYSSVRVMQDRREQARQDLKGLEETVVRKTWK